MSNFPPAPELPLSRLHQLPCLPETLRWSQQQLHRPHLSLIHILLTCNQHGCSGYCNSVRCGLLLRLNELALFPHTPLAHAVSNVALQVPATLVHQVLQEAGEVVSFS